MLRPQISRQLNNFKKVKCGLSLVRLMLGKDELTGKLQEGLGMPAKEFVASTLSYIKKQSSPNLDFNNFSRIINAFPENTGINDQESECCKLLANLVDRWTTYAAEEFPKTAANLSCAASSLIEIRVRPQIDWRPFWETPRLHMLSSDQRDWREVCSIPILGH